jgi:hypothetical protein
VFHSLWFSRTNFPKPSINFISSELLITQELDHFKMMKKTKHLIKITTPKSLFESLYSFHNYGFPCFLWSKNRNNWRLHF